MNQYQYDLPSGQPLPRELMVEKTTDQIPLIQPDLKTYQSSDQHSEIKVTSKKIGRLTKPGTITLDITVPWKELKLVEPPLGDGGFGVVYRGYFRGEEVAIKKLKVQTISEKALQELCQEAEIMLKISSESAYIVSVKKICLEAPHYALVMELMPKGSLYHILHNQKELPWRIRYQIALDVSYGLHALHQHSILHLDLKSLNILLDDRFRAKLSDFGLSRLKQETVTQTSDAKGTPQWMAPELFQRKAAITTATDIYSLGMVFWELVTREIPYKDSHDQQVIISWIKAGEKEEIPKHCPGALKALIESCWNEPTKRPTAVQVAAQLKPLLLEEKKSQSTETLSSSKKEKEHQIKSSSGKTHEKDMIGLDFIPPTLTTPLLSSARSVSLFGENKKVDKYNEQLISLQSQLREFEAETAHRSLDLEERRKKEELLQKIEKAKERLKSEKDQQIEQYQRPLIHACENGDLEGVKRALLSGADLRSPDSMGKLATPAAIWAMNIEVINFINARPDKGILSWEECETHNKEHYGQIFYCPEDKKECTSWLEQQKIVPEDKQNKLLQIHGIEIKEIKKNSCYSLCNGYVHHENRDLFHEKTINTQCNRTNESIGATILMFFSYQCYWFPVLGWLGALCNMYDDGYSGQALEHVFCCACPCPVKGTVELQVIDTESVANKLLDQMAIIREIQKKAAEKSSLEGSPLSRQEMR